MTRAKMLLFDYDYIVAENNVITRAVCLTSAEVQILLTMMDYVGWATRWESKTGVEIDQDKIDLYRDRLLGKLMLQDCDMDCAEVIQCIIDDIDDVGDFIIALEIWLQNNGGTIVGGGDGTETGTLDGTFDDIMSGMTCNQDNVFGFTLQLVQLMNRIIEDFFEIVEQLTNFNEYAGAVLDSIPVLSSVTDFIEYFCENMADNYLAHYDTAYENELACELACIANTNGCELSFSDLLDIMSDRVNEDWTEVSLQQLTSVFINGIWSGTEYCNLAFYLLAFLMSKGAVWGGYSLETLQRIVTAFWNDPNSDWATLCDCQWIKLYVFDEDELDTWSEDQGLWANDYAYYSQIGVSYNQAQTTHTYSGFDGLTTIKVLRLWDQEVKSGQGLQLTVIHDGGTSITAIPMSTGGKKWVTKTYSPALDGVTSIKLELRHNDVPTGGSCAIEKIRLEGTGSNPPTT